MTRAKLVFIYTIVIGYALMFVIGVCASVGWFHINTSVTLTLFITPSVGIITALIQAKHMFDDPEAIKKLKQEHLDEVFALKQSQAEREAQLRQAYEAETAKLNAENEKLKAELQKKQSEIQGLQGQIAVNKSRPPNPAPGNTGIR